MRILVTGATGFLGTRLCQALQEAGHTLVALSRDPASAKQRMPMVDQVFPWAPIQSLPPAEAFDGVEAVIHLAGETVAGRWTPAKKQLIHDSRVLGTRHLVEAMKELKTPPKVLISASAIGYYGHRDDEALTEESPPGSDFLAQVCRAWEEEALKAEELSLRVVRLRIGIVLGPGGGALSAMQPLFQLGLGGPLGSGRQWWSWVHRDDVVGLMEHALLDSHLSGPVNATAPQPLPQREFARTLGRVLQRPAFLPAPAFALKLVLGAFSGELLSSRRVLPQRAQEIGYSFRFPELEPALRAALQR